MSQAVEEESQTALATRQETSIAELMEQKKVILREQIARDLTDAEFEHFTQVCVALNLNPFTRQIYATKRSGRMVLQTGIDGYRAIAHRTRELAGIDDVIFDREDGKNPNKATCTVYRIVKGQRCAFTATVRWSEFNPGNNPQWQKMPYHMIAKVSESHALRKGFPEQLSGLYTDAEMDQAYDNVSQTAVHRGNGVRRNPVATIVPETGEVIEAEVFPAPDPEPTSPEPRPANGAERPASPAQLALIARLSGELGLEADTENLLMSGANEIIKELNERKRQRTAA